MSLYTLSRVKYLPAIKKPRGLTIVESTDTTLMSRLGNTAVEEVTRRFANDHLAFVAYMHGHPAAFGWMARGKATIGEFNIYLVGHYRHRSNFRIRSPSPAISIYGHSTFY